MTYVLTTNTKRQNPAMILLVHCQLDTSSSWVTTGANIIVPNPEPHVEIPEKNNKYKRRNYFANTQQLQVKISKMNVTNLTSDKGALFLKPVANGSDGRNIHEPQTETTHNSIRDLWKERVNNRAKN